MIFSFNNYYLLVLICNKFKTETRYLDQEAAKWPLRSSSQAAICYYQSNHWKVEAIPLSAFPKDITSEVAGLSAHYPFNAER